MLVRRLLILSFVFSLLAIARHGDGAEIVAPQNHESQLYKQVLFHYFQGDHEGTLLAVALAESQLLTASLPPQIDLIKGAASLSLGMHQQAQSIFMQLLSAQVDRQVEAKSWFFLAKSAFENQQFLLVEQAISNLRTKGLHKLLEQNQQYELHYQIAMLAIAAGGNTDLSGQLEQLPEGNVHRPYLLYNQAMLAAQNLQLDTALAALNLAQKDLTVNPDEGWFGLFGEPVDEALRLEKQALSDKVLMAKGQVYLKQQNYAEAEQQFAQMGQDSVNKDEALFHYAQAIYQGGNWQQAMTVWQYLKQTAPGYVVYPAAFALANGLAEQGDAQQASITYQYIENKAKDDKNKLDTLLDQIETPTHQQDDFLNQDADERWQGVVSDIWLAFASGENAYKLRQYQLLGRQYSQLKTLQDRAAHLLVLIDEREHQRATRARLLASDTHQTSLSELKQGYRELAKKLQDADDSHEVLADAQQIKWLKRLDDAYTRMRLLEAQQGISPSYQQRLSRIKGILQWQLADEFVPRKWQVQQQLSATQEQIEKAQHQLERVKSLSVSTDDFGNQRARIASLQARLQIQESEYTSSRSELRLALVNAVKEKLQARNTQLEQYLYHSKLARLRLQDMPAEPDEVAMEGSDE